MIEFKTAEANPSREGFGTGLAYAAVADAAPPRPACDPHVACDGKRGSEESVVEGMQAKDCWIEPDAVEQAAREWRMRIEQAQSVQEIGRMIQIEARRRAAVADGWSKSIPSAASQAAAREGQG